MLLINILLINLEGTAGPFQQNHEKIPLKCWPILNPVSYRIKGSPELLVSGYVYDGVGDDLRLGRCGRKCREEKRNGVGVAERLDDGNDRIWRPHDPVHAWRNTMYMISYVLYFVLYICVVM